MIVDGRAIAKEMLDEVAQGAAQASPAPRLAVITCAPNFETQKYLALKKRKAAEVGISTIVIELLADCSTDDAVKTVQAAAGQSDGIVVQLPLPSNIDAAAVLAAIPVTHDIDGIHYTSTGYVLPPVVGAIAEIAQRYQVDFEKQAVTVIGAGRLVGAPAAAWARKQGAIVTSITRDTSPAETAAALAQADIIISGAGVANLITPDQIKAGVALFDAGTSEDGGTLVGDADPRCADKAGLFTPVPGGIGPITVAYLLKNLIALMRQ